MRFLWRRHRSACECLRERSQSSLVSQNGWLSVLKCMQQRGTCPCAKYVACECPLIDSRGIDRYCRTTLNTFRWACSDVKTGRGGQMQSSPTHPNSSRQSLTSENHPEKNCPSVAIFSPTSCFGGRRKSLLLQHELNWVSQNLVTAGMVY